MKGITGVCLAVLLAGANGLSLTDVAKSNIKGATKVSGLPKSGPSRSSYVPSHGPMMGYYKGSVLPVYKRGDQLIAQSQATAAGPKLQVIDASMAMQVERPKGSSIGAPAGKGERQYIIGGNWKCNGDKASVVELINIINNAGPIPANVEVVVGAPYIHLGLVLSHIRDDVQVAAQNCGVNSACGAYTGEICAKQLVDFGVDWVIVGHSERRQGFEMPGEPNELVAKKAKVALDSGLKVMLCIGEKKEERESGVTMDVIAAQLDPVAKLLTNEDWDRVVLAYEPVWAIGTGLTATPEMAEETHKNIRDWMAANTSPEIANAIRIQYGGSMKGENAKDLLAQPDIDGGLIGGAALTADFINIFNGAPAAAEQ